MTGPVGVFVAGIIGVFLGMAFLYLSIRLTGAAVTAYEARGKAADADNSKEAK